MSNIYSTLTKDQKDVYNAAKFRLRGKKWFKGICMDDFPSDELCRTKFLQAVDEVIFNTEFWDSSESLPNVRARG